ncbi:hypothetical protein CJU33_33135, partial [Pseudomonas aeruginosa]
SLLVSNCAFSPSWASCAVASRSPSKAISRSARLALLCSCHARLSGEVAALRREAELMGEERQRASQAEARWASERQGREE